MVYANLERRRAYQRNWRKSHKERAQEYHYEYITSPTGIYGSLLRRAKYEGKSITISKEDFIKWVNLHWNDRCFYCGYYPNLNLKEFEGRSPNRLTIDRLDNSKGYILGNLTWACFRCNMTKSDFFTVEEMKEIGKIIRKKWESQKKFKIGTVRPS